MPYETSSSSTDTITVPSQAIPAASFAADTYADTELAYLLTYLITYLLTYLLTYCFYLLNYLITVNCLPKSCYRCKNTT